MFVSKLNCAPQHRLRRRYWQRVTRIMSLEWSMFLTGLLAVVMLSASMTLALVFAHCTRPHPECGQKCREQEQRGAKNDVWDVSAAAERKSGKAAVENGSAKSEKSGERTPLKEKKSTGVKPWFAHSRFPSRFIAASDGEINLYFKHGMPIKTCDCSVSTSST